MGSGAHTLTELLRARGAEVRIVEIPDDGNGEKVGADDYIARRGPYEFLKLLWNNWVSARDVEKVLHQPPPRPSCFVEARELAKTVPARPPFVIDKLLPEGGTCMIAASPKVGKSGIALNAAKAVATGEPFLAGSRCARAVRYTSRRRSRPVSRELSALIIDIYCVHLQLPHPNMR